MDIPNPIAFVWHHDDAPARSGYRVSGEYLTEDDLRVQYSERARCERQPDGTVTPGRVGAGPAAARGLPGVPYPGDRRRGSRRPRRHGGRHPSGRRAAR